MLTGYVSVACYAMKYQTGGGGRVISTKCFSNSELNLPIVVAEGNEQIRGHQEAHFIPKVCACAGEEPQLGFRIYGIS